VKAFVAGFVVVGAALGQAPLQEDRAAQQEAYRTWRQADPNLERDATSAGATLGARADKVAAGAAGYFSVSKTYLENLAAGVNRSASLLQPVEIVPGAPPNIESYLKTQDTILQTSISTITQDPDPGIQQLRQTLERERTAVGAVNAALTVSQTSQQAVVQANGRVEQAREQVAGQYQKLAASLQESVQLAEQSGAAWAGYYRALSDAARGVGAPVTSSGPTNPSVAGTNPPPSPVTRTVTAVPLARYVGAWTYPTIGAHYHGMQPQSVELVVREDNGQVSGTLSARFRVPPGNTSDPVVRLNFSGAFGSSRAQKFTATTSNGATGTMELIPGPAFNLLEVNFSIEDKPGTIRQGNFLLIKQ